MQALFSNQVIHSILSHRLCCLRNFSVLAKPEKKMTFVEEKRKSFQFKFYLTRR